MIRKPNLQSSKMVSLFFPSRAESDPMKTLYPLKFPLKFPQPILPIKNPLCPTPSHPVPSHPTPPIQCNPTPKLVVFKKSPPPPSNIQNPVTPVKITKNMYNKKV